MGGADPKKNRADRQAAHLMLDACLDLRDGVPYSEVYKKYRADVALPEPGTITIEEGIEAELDLIFLTKNLVCAVAGAAIERHYPRPPGDGAAARLMLAGAIETLAPFPAWMKDEALAALAALDLGEVRPLLAPARPGRRAGYTLARWRVRFVGMVKYRQAAGGSAERARREIADRIGAAPETVKSWEGRLPALLADEASFLFREAAKAGRWARAREYTGGDYREWMRDVEKDWPAPWAERFEADWADLDGLAAAYRAACRRE